MAKPKKEEERDMFSQSLIRDTEKYKGLEQVKDKYLEEEKRTQNERRKKEHGK